MSEWYARDISKKIKSVFQSKGRKGIPISSKAPYGYRKNPADKTRWIIDEPAAAVVRRIYSLINEGKGPHQVARILHDDKIEKPSYYLAKNGIVNKSGALDTPHPYSWQAFTVSHIVGRIEYLGHLANFKHEKPSFKSKKFVTKPKEEWLIFENAHEPIVTHEVWEIAQKMRETKRRIDTTGEANPLTGLLYCAKCNSKMFNTRKTGTTRKSDDNYCCGNYKNSKNGFEEPPCTQHYVTTYAMNKLLLEVIQKTTVFVREREDEFIEMVKKSSSLKQDETIKSHTRDIAKNERRVVELDTVISKLFEQSATGKISESRFENLLAGYEQEQSDLREQAAVMQAEVDAWTEDKGRVDNFVNLVRKYTRIEELTTPMLYEFIERVEVHEAVWSEATETQKRKGTRSQQIDVYLKYVGNFTAPDIRTPEEIEAERKEEERLARVRGYKRKYNRKIAAEKTPAEVAVAETETAIPKPAA